MSDYQWTVHGEDYDVVVDGLLGDFATRTRGETVSLTLALQRRVNPSSPGTGGQYAGDAGFQWSGDAGAQYAGGGSDVSPLPERYRRLVAYHEYAGAADTFTDAQQVPAFQEAVPSRAPISSLLVGIEPAAELAGAPGFWGVVAGGGDGTARLGESARVSLDIFVLAGYDDYADHAAVRSEFEPPY